MVKRLKTLGIYTALVLLVFSFLVPAMGRIKQAEQVTMSAETPIAAADTPAVTKPVLPQDSDIAEAVIPAALDTGQIPEPAKQAAADITKIIWPVKGKIIREFGLTYSHTFSDYRYHSGIDIEAKEDTEVVAVLAGTVLNINISKDAANSVIIEHGNGWRSEYAHLGAVRVKVGEAVAAGQAIGTVGQPGRNEMLEVPHLHYNLLKDGKAVNPLGHLRV